MRKLYFLIVIVSGLIITAYFFVRFKLQDEIRDSGNQRGDTTSVTHTPDSTLDLRPLFIARIRQLVKQGSGGLYNISITNMKVDLMESQVILENVKLLHDPKILSTLDSLKQAPDDVFEGSFEKLVINGINLDDVLSRKTLDFKEIKVTNPIIEVYHSNRKYNPENTTDSITLYDRIMKDMTRIAIQKLDIQNGKFISHNVSKNKIARWSDVTLLFTDILIDSSTENSIDRFLFAKRASFSTKNYVSKSKDDAYIFKIGELTFQAPQQSMTIENLSLASRYNRQQFQKMQTHQKELYNFTVPKITLHNIDWWALIQDDHFIANEINITDAKLNIYLDRSLPKPTSKMGNFPHQLIMKLPIPLNITSMHIRNLDLTYQEYNPQSTQTGTINFDHVNLDISHISNIAQQIKKNKETIVTGTALLRNIPVKARFVLDLINYKTGRFTSNITAGGFEGKTMNDITESLGLFKIQNGTVREVIANIQGNEQQASGKILLLYNNLKISLYEKEKGKRGLDKRGILGFIANKFVIKDDNPTQNNQPRNPSTTFLRNPQAGFINLVWKTTLTGILETIGANPNLAKGK